MKKWLMKIVWIFLLMFLSCLSPAYAQGSDVTVSLPLTAEDQFTLIFDIEGMGTAYDGDMPIRNGRMIYSLSVGKSKEFHIIADEDYTMKILKADHENIIVNGNIITVSSVSAETTLSVRFVKNDKNDKNDKSKTDEATSSQNQNTKQVPMQSESQAKNVSSTKEKIDHKNHGKAKDDASTKKLNEDKKEDRLSNDILTFMKEKLATSQGILTMFILVVIIACGIIVHKRRKG